MSSDPLPRHIAIIMDGNGRWARARSKARIRGHEEGVNRVREIVEECSSLGVEVLTLYAFSAENWSRPHYEVDLLMLLLRRFARSERAELVRQNVIFSTLGDTERLPERVQKELVATQKATEQNSGLRLQLALSYGGRDEILRAIKRLAQSGHDISSLTEEVFSQYLDTSWQADPDLVIRTSGEQRLSNFLIWQSAYSELYFTKCYWPDFTKEELHKAIEDFQKRERRFGGLGKTRSQKLNKMAQVNPETKVLRCKK